MKKMKLGVCQKCIDAWAVKSNRQEWRWNHTVFDASFWEDKIVYCPFAGSRSKPFRFKDGPPEHCEHKEEHKGK